MRHLFLAVILACISMQAPALVVEPQKTAPSQSNKLSTDFLIGKWSGTYQCAQGLTNVEIDVGKDLSGVFRFFSSTSTMGAFDGFFYGKFHINGSNIIWQPKQNNIDGWNVAPNDGGRSWVTIGFSATPNKNNKTMSGNIQFTGCSTINLSLRQGTATASAQVKPMQTKAPPSEESVRFCRAVINGNLDMARLYLSKGADINCEDCSGYSGNYTPLMHMVHRIEYVRFLLENGANINQQNVDGITALMRATGARQSETITLLIENGADASLKDRDGHDALYYLVNVFYENQDPPLIRYLLSKGASINQQGNNGISPLMVWASNCDARATKLFLSLGADPSLKTKLGETALMMVEKIAVNSPQGSACNQTYSVLSDPERYKAASSTSPTPSVGIPASNNAPSNSVYSTYAGNYSGNYSGDDNGPFQVTVEQDGNIKLTGKSLRNNQAFTGNGKMNSDGSLGITLGSISTGATFQGSINPKTGGLYGTWKNGEQAGNFSGSKQTAQAQTANPIEAIGGLLNVLNKALAK